jgi:phosphohistidine swiveling domain-containing protein
MVLALNSLRFMGHLFALFGISFCLGAFPFIAILFFLFTKQRLSRLGVGNLSVSAAFYQGGTVIGILAVLSEAAKGIGVVALARDWYPDQPVYQLLALCFLVLGRYLIGKGAGTTNVVWGIAAYQWRVAFFVLLISGGFFLGDRDRTRSKYLVLFLLPLLIAVMVQEVLQTLVAMLLGGLLAVIYLRINDDLTLNGQNAKNAAMFHFLKGKMPHHSLDQALEASTVGEKAANLSFLMRQGYTVPAGWVLKAGDDPEQFVAMFQPSKDCPMVARSSAVGEDSMHSSAAGQYETVLNITSQRALLAAIARCQDSFENANAVHYRQTHQIEDSTMAVLVQPQINSQISGVVFSRDPMESWTDQVVIESVLGQCNQLVSGQMTPARFTVSFARCGPGNRPSEQDIRGDVTEIPQSLILEVACLARKLEETFQGVPQDVEWTFDGQQLWVLQSRPITTSMPIWTRKIAAEVIPGLIHPLTWSINQPLTCGVWGNLFEVVLGKANSQDLEFQNTAQLNFGRAYFNASLLGQIFLRMGLPPESLEFLTQGAAISPPRGLAILKSLPGLTRLVGRELKLSRQFKRERPGIYQLLELLDQTDPEGLDHQSLKGRIEEILRVLESVTYFQIMVPLSFALRKKLFRLQDDSINTAVLPEIAAMEAIASLASKIPASVPQTPEAILTYLQSDEGVKPEWNQFLSEFGYLSEVATDISVPTWREHPEIVARSVQLLRGQTKVRESQASAPKSRNDRSRLALKGEVAQVYNRLLAHLRWTFVSIEKRWINQGVLNHQGDLFFLEWSEVKAYLEDSASSDDHFHALVSQRRSDFDALKALDDVPAVVYGRAPARLPSSSSIPDALDFEPVSVMEGIGASAGQVEGVIQLIASLQDLPHPISPNMILVVPFTDAGWAPIFANAGGIISEVGGRLSHGAIVAREYGIPAVMDVKSALKRLRNGQNVRIDGLTGRIEILS